MPGICANVFSGIARAEAVRHRANDAVQIQGGAACCPAEWKSAKLATPTFNLFGVGEDMIAHSTHAYGPWHVAPIPVKIAGHAIESSLGGFIRGLRRFVGEGVLVVASGDRLASKVFIRRTFQQSSGATFQPPLKSAHQDVVPGAPC
jgi:hypothetical protein